ncbi:ComEA family DNA-binding protein [Microbacterium azadirachtae]|uniref:ComE operon protein 1 n=1 Tax=Microbacterium azadirachtae TaxID=582680 RepID=A0A0F0KDL8_9MICO|nr:ComEA family DNA-binding protein [Microbacterium azadirachtae]KJL17361.1 ComE operon protein 1 [Microbacterium azadirachtae]UXW87341.1 ComEA family DNA-binding protein [Microbacterium azadirachtae]SDL18830.1 competence protein ComEA [Microbacterium azadirachtae]SEF49274.1 competence protein ComEA [Microbacterium azadirachtae]SEF49369.1 competence protein ComEA [Microbacterium azadirachtae]
MTEIAESESTEPVVVPGRRRLRLGLGAAVVVALAAVSVTVGIGLVSRSTGPAQIAVTAEPSAGGRGISAGSVYVHVLGDVATPGLYVLDDGARVADALAAAGGTLPTADLAAVNLARPLTDGEQILVPAQGGTPDSAGSAGSPSTAVPATTSALIDLNTADAAALEELPRVGPAIAQRIIEWRTANGRFTSVDDLLGVSGIGEKMLAGIRDRVRV